MRALLPARTVKWENSLHNYSHKRKRFRTPHTHFFLPEHRSNRHPTSNSSEPVPTHHIDAGACSRISSMRFLRNPVVFRNGTSPSSSRGKFKHSIVPRPSSRCHPWSRNAKLQFGSLAVRCDDEPVRWIHAWINAYLQTRFESWAYMSFNPVWDRKSGIIWSEGMVVRCWISRKMTTLRNLTIYLCLYIYIYNVCVYIYIIYIIYTMY